VQNMIRRCWAQRGRDRAWALERAAGKATLCCGSRGLARWLPRRVSVPWPPARGFYVCVADFESPAARLAFLS
jgi:hypothetical protein